MAKFLSWGRYPHKPQTVVSINWPDETQAMLAELKPSTTLAVGYGRSYGDSCLAVSNQVFAISGMDRLLAADWQSGRVFAQAGLSLANLIKVVMPHGWFPCVTPGTKFVSLGGAVANDVHGKNHHVMGTFGQHVKKLLLYRSDLGLVECSADNNPELFRATIGGLGLTGVILAVELQLRNIKSSNIQQQSIRFGSLDEFFQLSKQHDSTNEYTVAWVDCLASGKQAGRGHFIAGNHCEDGSLECSRSGNLKMPIDPPVSLVNSLSLRAFNTLYYHRQRQVSVKNVVGYEPFFYPLDGIQQWNRLYGRKGFQQYQCVVPQANAQEVIRNVMREVSLSGTGSFLAVLKQCGGIVSPGLLSFPMPGTSLALDFPQHDQVNTRLFKKLDCLVHEAGGRLYPAKDAHMEALHFQQAYPAWQKIETLRDPQLMSHFWQRVTQ